MATTKGLGEQWEVWWQRGRAEPSCGAGLGVGSLSTPRRLVRVSQEQFGHHLSGVTDSHNQSLPASLWRCILPLARAFGGDLPRFKSHTTARSCRMPAGSLRGLVQCQVTLLQ